MNNTFYQILYSEDLPAWIIPIEYSDIVQQDKEYLINQTIFVNKNEARLKMLNELQELKMIYEDKLWIINNWIKYI